MTSPPNQQVSPGDVDAWKASLTSAFEVLLGQPLDTFDPDATYALYHWDDGMSEEFLELFDVEALGMVVPPDLTATRGDPFSPPRWSLDLRRSLFFTEMTEFSESIDTALEAASLDEEEVVVTGADLAAILANKKFDPEEQYLTTFIRVDTDGTLFDAMCAATWTMDGPETMVPFDTGVEVDKRWDDALKQVSPPALRDHLRMLCLTSHWSRSRGARYPGPGPGDPSWLAKQPGHTRVTGWEFGEGQAWSEIVQIAP